MSEAQLSLQVTQERSQLRRRHAHPGEQRIEILLGADPLGKHLAQVPRLVFLVFLTAFIDLARS